MSQLKMRCWSFQPSGCFFRFDTPTYQVKLYMAPWRWRDVKEWIVEIIHGPIASMVRISENEPPTIQNIREQLYVSLSRIPHIFSCGANHINTKWEYFPRLLHNFPRQHDPSTSHIRTQLHNFSRCKQGTRALHLQMLFWVEVCMEMRISRSFCLEILNAELG